MHESTRALATRTWGPLPTFWSASDGVYPTPYGPLRHRPSSGSSTGSPLSVRVGSPGPVKSISHTFGADARVLGPSGTVRVAGSRTGLEGSDDFGESHSWTSWTPYAGAARRARPPRGCFAGRGLKRGGVIFLYPSSGLSAAAQYRLPRSRRRIVPVSLPPAGAGHVRNDPRHRRRRPRLRGPHQTSPGQSHSPGDPPPPGHRSGSSQPAHFPATPPGPVVDRHRHRRGDPRRGPAVGRLVRGAAPSPFGLQSCYDRAVIGANSEGLSLSV